MGTIHKDAPLRVALVYPSPYQVAVASLGYQTLYRLLNEIPGVCCERAVLESWRAEGPLRTLETGRPLGDVPVLGLSVATEAEVASAARALSLGGVEPRESARRGLWAQRRAPLVVAGGPLTAADGRPLAALADVVIHGEAEDGLSRLAELLARGEEPSEALLVRFAELPGAEVPALGGNPGQPELAQADDRWLPARAAVTSPRSEFGDMYLIEAARGCPRRCAFCVMEPQGFRQVEAERVLDGVPEEARRVGIVGAALGHHRQLRQIVAALVDRGCSVSLSSLRADRLDEALLELLVRGGLRTLTVAADGASERLRQEIRKKVRAEDLLRAAELAAAQGLRSIKLYAMVGLPGETDDDLGELLELSLAMAARLPVSLAVSPFVPKARTSLAAAEMAPMATLRRRLGWLRKQLRGRVELRSTSVRAAWIENAVARGGIEAGLAAIDVAREGESFAAWKRAAACHRLLERRD